MNLLALNFFLFLNVLLSLMFMLNFCSNLMLFLDSYLFLWALSGNNSGVLNVLVLLVLVMNFVLFMSFLLQTEWFDSKSFSLT
jgi:hypothetical protein